jgi:very-short-patch-repair endonuclease
MKSINKIIPKALYKVFVLALCLFSLPEQEQEIVFTGNRNALADTYKFISDNEGLIEENGFETTKKKTREFKRIFRECSAKWGETTPRNVVVAEVGKANAELPNTERVRIHCEAIAKYVAENKGNIDRKEIQKIWTETYPEIKAKDNPKVKCKFGGTRSKGLCNNYECITCWKRSAGCKKAGKFWDYERNEDLPREVYRSSGLKYHFYCNECGHDFEATMNKIDSGRWCGYCSSQKMCSRKECDFCRKKSFEVNPMSEYWDTEMNDGLTPRDVAGHGKTKYWFHCYCGHRFQATTGHVSEGKWCPFCSSPVKELCKDMECELCREHSFLSNPHSKEWNYELNGGISPRFVLLHSAKKYWFYCSVCGHDFDTSPAQVAGGKWCRFCAHQELCSSDDCKYCFNNSIASLPQSEFWNYEKNGISPRMVYLGSNCKKYWFHCRYGHDFDITPLSVSRGQWCRFCHNKTEEKMRQILIKFFPSLECQKKFDWLRSEKGNNCFFDFFIPELNLIIELDGDQHFVSIPYWYSNPEDAHKRDVLKMGLAKEHGISMIRLYQPDVLLDTYDFSTIFSLLEKYPQQTPTVKCIGNIYDKTFEKYIIEDVLVSILESVQ